MRSVPEQILRGVLIGIVLYILFGVLGCFDSGNEMLPEVIKSLEAPSAKPLNFPVRFYYVKDPDGIFHEGAEDQFREAIRESQQFFADASATCQPAYLH